MEEQHDGGPAFPSPGIVDSFLEATDPVYRPNDRTWRTRQIGGGNGMSLRDYFAGQALAVLLSDARFNFDVAGEIAYRLANAMLVAREKKP